MTTGRIELDTGPAEVQDHDIVFRAYVGRDAYWIRVATDAIEDTAGITGETEARAYAERNREWVRDRAQHALDAGDVQELHAVTGPREVIFIIRVSG